MVNSLALEASPLKTRENSERYGSLRNFSVYLTEHKNFDPFIMYCIMANTFLLGFVWYMQPDSYLGPLEKLNYTFLVIFSIEALLKIVAQGFDYFEDKWNRFDFSIVFLTWIIITLFMFGIGQEVEILGTILRTLRIMRIFRMIQK